MAKMDLIIKQGNVVFPIFGILKTDIGIKGEKIIAIGKDLDTIGVGRVIDAKDKYVFPGVIDSHFHIGIYRPMDEDAVTESTSAIYGGVTTICSYFRTGQNYLNKTGLYTEIFPEVMEKSKKSFLTDYAYHIAIMTPDQIKEMEMLVKKYGVSTFKYYMFYKLLNLAGGVGGDKYLMLNTTYDLGFLYTYMKEVSRLNEKFKEFGEIRLSIHCEQPEIIRIFTQILSENPSSNALKDYSDARPTFSEKLAIREAEVLAVETNCPLNLLHLSSQEALEAGKEAVSKNPRLNILLESTLHHLGLSYDNPYGKLGKVNPPIRSSQDVEALWESIRVGEIKTVVSDHACLTQKLKEGDLWTSLPGFGGTELILPLLFTEGYLKRKLPIQRIAEITSYYPAIYHGLFPKKGIIEIGSDADITIVDPEIEKTISPQTLHSVQDFTPFEGMKYKGWPIYTILRGKIVLEKDKILGQAGDGQYIKRPVKLHYPEFRDF